MISDGEKVKFAKNGKMQLTGVKEREQRKHRERPMQIDGIDLTESVYYLLVSSCKGETKLTIIE